MAAIIKNNEQARLQQITPVLAFCITISGLGLVSSILHFGKNLPASTTAISWILACLISGCFFGFLFGIPKTQQADVAKKANGTSSPTNGTANQNNAYRQEINNNLIEISDWLTKIIVGLGLVNLTKTPQYMESLAGALSRGLGNGKSVDELAIAYGIIVCYFVTGFIFGYLATRLYLAGAFAQADQANLSEIQTLLSANSAKIDTLEANQALLNETVYPDQVGDSDEHSIDDLKKQASDYMDIDHSSYSERVRLKNVAVNKMTSFALSQQISKSQIFEAEKSDPNEGLIITLANLVITNPEISDSALLINVAERVKRLHVKYRILNAFSKLITERLLPVSLKQAVADIVQQYRTGADKPLMEKLDSLQILLNSYIS